MTRTHPRVASHVCAVLLILGLPLLGLAGQVSQQEIQIAQLASAEFVQIPGPNPILVPSATGWDSGVIEASDAFKDHDTYYLYYHGTEHSYQLGVASAEHPLGPWTKCDKNPILKVGPKDAWDSVHVACAFVLKEKTDQYSMWYSGYGKSQKWGIGLATASHPLGPWTKHAENPIMDHFGYVGGVVKHQGQYYLYTAHPIGSTGAGYSPMSLAIAERAQGPYEPYEGNPVLQPDPWGSWDDGGYSEAEVLFHDGVFHMFYGAGKLHPTRILTRESIGYAYSLDGKHFVKYPRNPVAVREMVPDGAAFAEVHALVEGPLIYLFHTLRYNSRQGAEDLGVQVLATQRPFKLRMPVLIKDSLPPNTTTSLQASVPLCLDSVSSVMISAACRYHEASVMPLTIHVKASCDGINYDTVDLQVVHLPCQPGQRVAQTFAVSAQPRYLKVQVENSDQSQGVSELKVFATLGG